MSEAMATRRNSRNKRRVADPSPAGRFVVILATFLSVIIVVYVLAVTVVLPRLRISRVVVQADFEMDRDSLLQLAGIGPQTYYFNIDEAAVTARLEEYPPIRSAVVTREFPQTVVLTIDRRRPLVVSLLSDGASTPVAIDDSGTIYLSGADVVDLDLPVLSGLSFQGDVVGSSLPDSMNTLLASLYDLRVDSPALYETISEIRIDGHRAGTFDILVFFQGFRVPVRIDTALDEDTCTYALMVLDVLVQQGIASTVEELDFRSGEIVYRMKEDQDAGE